MDILCNTHTDSLYKCYHEIRSCFVPFSNLGVNSMIDNSASDDQKHVLTLNQNIDTIFTARSSDILRATCPVILNTERFLEPLV